MLSKSPVKKPVGWVAELVETMASEPAPVALAAKRTVNRYTPVR